jgi:hypothetical protein
MISNLILRMLGGFEVQVTKNQRLQSPIPLHQEPDTGETKIEKVKVKLCRTPTLTSYSTYEMSYPTCTGHKVNGYCKFRAILDEYVKQAPLNNVNDQVNAVSFLLSGVPLSNCQNMLS